MSHFILKSKKASGEVYSREMDATDRYELYKLIRDAGEELIEFKEKEKSKGLHMEISLGRLGEHVRTIEKINFARNLGSMLSAGLSLSRCLLVLEKQTRNRAFKKILALIIADIDKGLTLSDALGKHSRVFPPLLISIVHAGEQSGTLADSLKITAEQMERSYSLEKKVRGSLMYPAVIVSAMIIIAVLMFTFVVPTLLKTFTDLNVELPLTTRIILGISYLFTSYGFPIFILIILAAGTLIWWSRQKTGKKFLHALNLKIPIIGVLIQEVNTARTARTLSSLLSSGVDVVESVMITSSVVQNVHFREVLSRAAETIKKGDLMSKTFSESNSLYPVFFSEMMGVGEETGKMGEMLGGVAKYYEEDVELRTKDMSTIIEPFLILIIGAAVALFALAMIQPMYSLVEVI